MINKIFVETSRSKYLKKGIWLYFILLIVEGGLRKWILPGFANQLLVIRDPLAIWLLLMGYRYGLFKINGYVLAMWLIAFISLITSILIGHGSLVVAIFGLRIFVIQFPLIFLIGAVFSREDVLKIGHVLLWVTIPMTILMTIQFYSEQSAWVNKGVGDSVEGAGFSGAMGYFRPPGTFSFINGLCSFYGLSAAFIFYFWIDRSYKKVKMFLLILSTVCLFIAIPLSISRTLFFQVGLVIIFMLLAVLRKSKYIGKAFLLCIGIALILLFLKDQLFFQIGIEAFSERLESATEVEGGSTSTFNRLLGGAFAMSTDQEIPFFGFGAGLGTNVGAMLMVGKTDFLIAEMEWGRIIGEFGVLLGGSIIIIRALIIYQISKMSFNQLRYSNSLPWMLLSFGFVAVLQGQWAQPSALGFAVLSGGLALAAARKTVRKVC